MRKLKIIAVIILAGFIGTAWAADVTESVTTSDSRERTYFLHTPPGYDGETPLPMVISLHYGGYNEGPGMAIVTGMSNKADSEEFIVVYPNALVPGWSNHDALFLDELVDTLKARYAVDERRIYMTGYSAGALMTHWMACKLSNEVAAYAPVAGTMLTYDWADCYPSDYPSIISFNARNDPLMPYDGNDGAYIAVEDAMSNWAERLNCDRGPDTFYDQNGALRQTWSRDDNLCEVVLWTTEDGGHGWPTESSLHKLSANDLMWDFFQAHPLPEEPGIEEVAAPPAFTINPKSPSVFTKSVTIDFNMHCRQEIELSLYDTQGRKIAVLFQGEMDEGNHSVMLDVGGLPSGVYFYRLYTPGRIDTRSIVLIK